MQIPRDQVTEPPPDPVAYHRRADLAAHDEADSGRLTAARPHQQVTDHERAPGPAALVDRHGELGPTAHPSGGRQHRPSPPHRQAPRGRDGAAQTLTRARPLRRRAARTARPARVRMRRRKPGVFARRRLFGWNVRLLTGTPGAVLGLPRHLERRPLGRRRAGAQLRGPWWQDLLTLRAALTTGQTSARRPSPRAPRNPAVYRTSTECGP